MVKIVLKRGEDKRIRAGHPWVFSNEIREISGEKEPGATAEIYDAGGAFVGTGYYNPRTLIAARLLARTQVDIDSAGFYRERIARAVACRALLYPGLATFRAVYGEGDFLPGSKDNLSERFYKQRPKMEGQSGKRRIKWLGSVVGRLLKRHASDKTTTERVEGINGKLNFKNDTRISAETAARLKELFVSTKIRLKESLQ